MCPNSIASMLQKRYSSSGFSISTKATLENQGVNAAPRERLDQTPDGNLRVQCWEALSTFSALFAHDHVHEFETIVDREQNHGRASGRLVAVAVILILVLSCLIFRGLGFAGVSVFATWQASARDALSLMLVFTGVSHFTSMREDFIRMMPPSLPWPRGLVYFTGVCEIAGAIGLLVPEVRRAAAYALIAFFLAVLPANIHAARLRITVRGKPATNLWVRIPMQVLFMVLAFWSAR